MKEKDMDNIAGYVAIFILVMVVGVLIAGALGYTLPGYVIIAGILFAVALTIPFLDTRH